MRLLFFPDVRNTRRAQRQGGMKKPHGTGENQGDQASIQKGDKFEVEQPRGTETVNGCVETN